MREETPENEPDAGAADGPDASAADGPATPAGGPHPGGVGGVGGVRGSGGVGAYEVLGDPDPIEEHSEPEASEPDPPDPEEEADALEPVAPAAPAAGVKKEPDADATPPPPGVDAPDEGDPEVSPPGVYVPDEGDPEVPAPAAHAPGESDPQEPAPRADPPDAPPPPDKEDGGDAEEPEEAPPPGASEEPRSEDPPEPDPLEPAEEEAAGGSEDDAPAALEALERAASADAEAPDAPDAAPVDPAPPADPPADPAAAQRRAVDEAAVALRRRMLRDAWLLRFGVASLLLLTGLALLIYTVRRVTGDAPWAVHLGWLAWGLPLVAWVLHQSADRNTVKAERLRTNIERGLRRRDDLPPPPDPRKERASGAGMLAAGVGALLVVGAATVPVARPRLEAAATTLSQRALGVEEKARALRDAGVHTPERAERARLEILGLAASPAGYAEADAKREGLRELEQRLDAEAEEAARGAGERLVEVRAASALADALDPGVEAWNPPPPPPDAEDDGTAPLPPIPTAAQLAGPGGLPPGASAALAELAARSFGPPAGPGGASAFPEELGASLRAADAARRAPSATDLAEASALLRDRRVRLGQLLQRLAEGGFGLRGPAASAAAADPVDADSLTERLRQTGRVDAEAVLGAAERLR